MEKVTLQLHNKSTSSRPGGEVLKTWANINGSRELLRSTLMTHSCCIHTWHCTADEKLNCCIFYLNRYLSAPTRAREHLKYSDRNMKCLFQTFRRKQQPWLPICGKQEWCRQREWKKPSQGSALWHGDPKAVFCPSQSWFKACAIWSPPQFVGQFHVKMCLSSSSSLKMRSKKNHILILIWIRWT